MGSRLEIMPDIWSRTHLAFVSAPKTTKLFLVSDF